MNGLREDGQRRHSARGFREKSFYNAGNTRSETRPFLIKVVYRANLVPYRGRILKTFIKCKSLSRELFYQSTKGRVADETKNYRGITLLSCPGKLFAHILL